MKQKFVYMLSQPSDACSSYAASVELQQPTLSLLNSLLFSVTTAFERAAEEKSLLLNKVRMQRNLSLYLHPDMFYIIACFINISNILYVVLQIRDINELSRQEVDEIINMCVRQDSVSSSDNIHKRLVICLY